MVRIGVDVGGTKIAFGLVDKSNKIVSEIVRFPVKPYKEGEALVAKLVEEVEKLISRDGYGQEDVAGIGIGSPGPLDLDTGTVLNTPNMPMLVNYGLRDAVQEASDYKVEVNNDANCFVLGEALGGQAQQGDIVVGVTLGTGYGCGLVFNKELFVGATGTAAEIARTPYLDSMLEEYISGRGLSQAYTRRSGEKADGKAISQLAQQGDNDALAAFEEFGMHVGKSFTMFANLLDPDFIVVGGSIANDWDFFIESITDTMDKYVNPNPKEHLQIVRSQLGESAAIIGAAGLISAD